MRLLYKDEGEYLNRQQRRAKINKNGDKVITTTKNNYFKNKKKRG